VLGYDVAGDTALLKLSGASGVATVSAGTGARAVPGQAVRAVGNAGGAGSLTVVRGTVTGLARSITVNTDRGTTQRLTGLIETNAPLRPGDSGGPLLDARGRVLGIDTAASVANGFVFQTSADDGYAIPIARALGVVRKIESGTASATVHVGPTAFLGIQAAATDQNGVGVAGVVPGSPADHAGLQEGDMITSVDSTPVASPRALVSLLLQKKPGRTITLVWTDRYGNRQSGSAKLVAGPPQ
jgi:S1-C subfamily serine protease